jgi:hypothetical protein
VLEKVTYMDITFHCVFMANSRLAKVVSAAVVRSAVRNSKQAVKLIVLQDGGCPTRTGIGEGSQWTTIMNSAKENIAKFF